MPLVRVEMLPGRSKEQKEALIKGITDVVVETLNTTAEGTTVIITETPAEHWARGGQTLAERMKVK